MPFEPTLPVDAPDLERASAFVDYLEEVGQRDRALRRPRTLSASLWQDLQPQQHLQPHLQPRDPGAAAAPAGRRAWPDVLEVLAASRRHGQALALYLRSEHRVVPLTVFPLQRLAHCPMRRDQFEALRLSRLQVLHVEPALLRPPGDADALRVGERRHYAPLSATSWLLAMRGPRSQVLPELAGARACRRVPGLTLDTPGLCGALTAALQRLGQETASLATIATWPGMDRARAARLLNGLYLQGALIVSRTHPAAHAG
ncbi:MAG: hypothetical protein ACOYLV_00830 [Rubrivivax sp.]